MNDESGAEWNPVNIVGIALRKIRCTLSQASCDCNSVPCIEANDVAMKRGGMEWNGGRNERSGVKDIGAPRAEEGEAAKDMTNLRSNPKGKRCIAMLSGA